MEKLEDTLVEHYRAIDDLKADFRNSNLFGLIASFVKGQSVADIGSGSGFFANLLKEKGKEVVGIEPNSGMREISLRINPQVRVIAGSAEEVDTLIREPVDAVVMIDVLEHVEKDDEQVKKIWSILKEEGEFILVVPAYPSLYGERDKQMHHYRRYTKASLTKILTDNGFSIMKMRYWNALGVLPYMVSEKVLKRPLKAEFRSSAKSGLLSRLIRKGLYFWFREVENRCNFGFGLSIIAIAKKS